MYHRKTQSINRMTPKKQYTPSSLEVQNIQVKNGISQSKTQNRVRGTSKTQIQPNTNSQYYSRYKTFSIPKKLNIQARLEYTIPKRNPKFIRTIKSEDFQQLYTCGEEFKRHSKIFRKALKIDVDNFLLILYMDKYKGLPYLQLNMIKRFKLNFTRKPKNFQPLFENIFRKAKYVKQYYITDTNVQALKFCQPSTKFIQFSAVGKIRDFDKLHTTINSCTRLQNLWINFSHNYGGCSLIEYQKIIKKHPRIQFGFKNILLESDIQINGEINPNFPFKRLTFFQCQITQWADKKDISIINSIALPKITQLNLILDIDSKVITQNLSKFISLKGLKIFTAFEKRVQYLDFFEQARFPSQITALELNFRYFPTNSIMSYSNAKQIKNKKEVYVVSQCSFLQKFQSMIKQLIKLKEFILTICRSENEVHSWEIEYWLMLSYHKPCLEIFDFTMLSEYQSSKINTVDLSQYFSFIAQMSPTLKMLGLAGISIDMDEPKLMIFKELVSLQLKCSPRYFYLEKFLSNLDCPKLVKLGLGKFGSQNEIKPEVFSQIIPKFKHLTQMRLDILMDDNYFVFEKCLKAISSYKNLRALHINWMSKKQGGQVAKTLNICQMLEERLLNIKDLYISGLVNIQKKSFRKFDLVQKV